MKNCLFVAFHKLLLKFRTTKKEPLFVDEWFSIMTTESINRIDYQCYKPQMRLSKPTRLYKPL